MSERPSAPGVSRFAGYPFPVAAPYRLMHAEAQPSTALQRLFDVVDMTLRFLGAGLAAEMMATEERQAIAPWLDKPLSTGAVHGWIRAAVERSRSGSAPPLATALRPAYLDAPSGRPSAARLLDELIAARNRTRGHGITLSEPQAKKLHAELEPKLEEALGLLTPLETFRPVVVKGMNDFDGEWYEHQVLLATGDNPYFPVQTMRTRRPLPFGRVYLQAPDDSLVSLHPFVEHAECVKCEEPHFFVLHSAHAGKVQHVDPLKGCVLRRTLDVATLLGPAPEPSGRRSFDGKARTTERSGPEGEGLAKGSVVAGRYEIREELGRGAGGLVYRALCRVTGEVVALKVLRLSEAAAATEEGRNVIERFQREAQAVGRLKHPSLVPVLDVGVDRGLHYYAMEVVEGQELRHRLKGGPLAVEPAVAVAAQLLGALAVAHEAGIVHRDVKPENVILQADGTARLTDFGVARVIGLQTITSQGEVVGTIGYMAPEQVDGRRVGPAADLFAVGVLLFEMLTGRRPFEGATAGETVTAILTAEAPVPSSLSPATPEWLDHVVGRLLEKDPDRRPADAHDALRLLAERERARTMGRRWRSRRRGARPDLEHVHPVVARDLVVGFASKVVLSELRLDVARGTRLALLGRNGSGKTTLLRTLLGACRPRSGSVSLFGAERAPRAEILAHVGYIPERPVAYPFMRLARFLDYLAAVQPRWDAAHAKHLVRRFDLDPAEKIGAMSRGRQTMVSVVAALSHRPPLLLLDDPTLGLDAIWIEEFRAAIAELTAARGTTVVFSTHDFDSVASIADRIGFLVEGRVCSELEMKDVARRYCKVRLVLPSDEEPSRLPEGFSVLDRKKRTISGTYHVQHVSPEEAFAPLSPAELETEAPSLKEVYFHVLRRVAPEA